MSDISTVLTDKEIIELAKKYDADASDDFLGPMLGDGEIIPFARAFQALLMESVKIDAQKVRDEAMEEAAIIAESTEFEGQYCTTEDCSAAAATIRAIKSSPEQPVATSNKIEILDWPGSESLADLKYATDVQDGIDPDYLATWQKLQVASRNLTIMRGYARQLRALLAPTTLEAPQTINSASKNSLPTELHRSLYSGGEGFTNVNSGNTDRVFIDGVESSRSALKQSDHSEHDLNMVDGERERFEAEYRDKVPMTPNFTRTSHQSSKYSDFNVQNCWALWQARAALQSQPAFLSGNPDAYALMTQQGLLTRIIPSKVSFVGAIVDKCLTEEDAKLADMAYAGYAPHKIVRLIIESQPASKGDASSGSILGFINESTAEWLSTIEKIVDTKYRLDFHTEPSGDFRIPFYGTNFHQIAAESTKCALDGGVCGNGGYCEKCSAESPSKPQLSDEPGVVDALRGILKDMSATYEAAKHGKPLVISIGQFGRLALANKILDAKSLQSSERDKSQTFDFVAHLARQAEWSEKTFGPGMRTAGVCDHIRKELLEIEADPTDLKEWTDVVILGLDGAWRCGGTPQQIIENIVAKQTKNEGRTWPDWRTADPDKAIEHDRSQDAIAAIATQQGDDNADI